MQNATFWDWTQDAIDVRRGIPVQLDLNADNFAAVAEEKGISTDRPVILYDDGFSGSMFACRYELLHWKPRCLDCMFMVKRHRQLQVSVTLSNPVSAFKVH